MSGVLRVLRRGLLTTVQDTGRAGHQREGVPVGGAMDEPALRLANLLVGNPPTAAGLEVTIAGPTLSLEGDVVFAVTGADVSLRLDDAPVPRLRAVRARPGARLEIGRALAGCRAYVAFAGGIDSPLVLGSRSTYLRGRLGGHEGRALRSGDGLPLGRPSTTALRISDSLRPGESAAWSPARQSLEALPRPADEITLRALRGHHFDALTPAAREAVWSESYRVGRDSDRMGYRLEGPPLALASPLELVTEPVAFGTVQLPPDGQPIVLMAERQTTGGYPRVLELASVDLPLLAQASPGVRVRFTETSLAEATRLYIAQEAELVRLALTIQLQHR